MSTNVYQVFAMDHGDSYFALVDREGFDWIIGEMDNKNIVSEKFKKEIWERNENVREHFEENYDFFLEEFEIRCAKRKINRVLYAPVIKKGEQEASFRLFSELKKFAEIHKLTIVDSYDYL